METSLIELFYLIFLSWVFLEMLPGVARLERMSDHSASLTLQRTSFDDNRNKYDLIKDFLTMLIIRFEDLILHRSKMKSFQDRISFLTKRNKVLSRQKTQLGSKISQLENQKLRDIETAKNEEIIRIRSGVLHELNTAMTMVSGVLDPIKKDLDELKSQQINERASTLLSEASDLLNVLEKGAHRALRSTRNFSKILPDPKSNNIYDSDLKEFLLYKKSWYAVSHPEVEFNLLLKRLGKCNVKVDFLTIVDHLLAIAFDSLANTKDPYLHLAVDGEGDIPFFVLSYNGNYPKRASKKHHADPQDNGDEVVRYLAACNGFDLTINRNPDGDETTSICLLGFQGEEN